MRNAGETSPRSSSCLTLRSLATAGSIPVSQYLSISASQRQYESVVVRVCTTYGKCGIEMENVDTMLWCFSKQRPDGIHKSGLYYWGNRRPLWLWSHLNRCQGLTKKILPFIVSVFSFVGCKCSFRFVGTYSPTFPFPSEQPLTLHLTFKVRCC